MEIPVYKSRRSPVVGMWVRHFNASVGNLSRIAYNHRSSHEANMRINHIGWFLFLALLSQVRALAQTTPVDVGASTPLGLAQASGFEPLGRWKAAVLAGDRQALAALYTTAPPASVETPPGKTEDSRAEPLFWSAFVAKGLKSVEPKILEAEKPQPGVVSLVLRIELTLQVDGMKEKDVVSATQVWVQQGASWRIAVTRRGDLNPSAPRRLPEPSVPNPELYPAPEEAEDEIDGALRAAAKDHKRVILVFGANWCYDCHVLDMTFHSQKIAPLVEVNYHVIHINIGEGDRNLDLANRYEIPLEKGIPSLAVLDPDGKLVFSQKDGEFESTTRIGPEDVVQFLEKWKPIRGD
jgi:thioredoxin 1